MKMFRMISGRSLAAVGLLVTLACSLAGQQLAQLPGLSLIGALVLALLLGMVLQGARSLRDAARTSTPFIANKFLRAGIILLGFKLNLVLLMGAGIKSLFAAIFLVTVMVSLNYVVARKFFGVEHTLALLTACGSSICGAAAVMGVSSAVRSKTDESVLAVAIVAILGTVFTLVLVALQPVLGFSEAQFGTLAGLSLHEIAHAVAAGSAGGPVSLDTAIITKLSRVLMLAPAAMIIGWWYQKQGIKDGSIVLTNDQKRVPIPWFMVGFILASVIGTFMPLGAAVIAGLVKLAYLVLGMAMAALGMSVNFKVLLTRGRNALLAAVLGSVVLLTFVAAMSKLFF